ncbi:MAG TPA: formylglycine-generating enzyme family protein [SAR324 cluster bacterium]|jgi:formylglycine-generating enzyme required for sulfatase activity|nr:formylglycine-generating enzyme family protein [SAR324 cluster bacterium]|tara:strand:- start:6776 stop:7678 length:903 start_codon:yes stop_codon:yes gene_type:complete
MENTMDILNKDFICSRIIQFCSIFIAAEICITSINTEKIFPTEMKNQNNTLSKPTSNRLLPQKTISPENNKVWTEPYTGIKFIQISGGTFEIGNPFGEGDKDEKYKRKITIKPFFLGQTEVTQTEWARLMESNPSRFKGGKYPVEKISIYDVNEFTKKMNELYHGKFLFRLPTEAEWEFACTEGGKKVRFCNGNNNTRNSEIHYGKQQTAPVASYAPNSFGLYDMSGNVWEWTCSEYSPHYNGNEEKCSLDFFQNNAVRGGSWGSKQRGVRASNRNVIYGGYGPSDADSHRGFRLARENR